jgi:hypothetical protein
MNVFMLSATASAVPLCIFLLFQWAVKNLEAVLWILCNLFLACNLLLTQVLDYHFYCCVFRSVKVEGGVLFWLCVKN